MKITKKTIGKYTDLYVLEGKENKVERMIHYNDILFENLYTIAQKQKQIIVINELKTGGVIFGNTTYIDKALEKLQDEKTDLIFSITTTTNSNSGQLQKIGFSIKKKNTWF